MLTIKGTAVCKGIATGRIFYFEKVDIEIPEQVITDAEGEWNRLENALALADMHLESLYNKALETVGESEAEIFDMHRLMLTDDDLKEMLEDKIKNRSMNALWAVSESGNEFAAFFENLDDEYMKARAADVKDVCALLLEILFGVSQRVRLESPSIVVADDLTPSETVRLDKKNILAFVTRGGSSNSHTAILARTMGIPSIVQAKLPEAADAVFAAVDGYEGVCYFDPDDETMALLAEKSEREAAYRRDCELSRGKPSVTLSGKEIKVFANIGGSEDIASVIENDADGIGLFRSEFLYIGRKAAPTEEVQFAAYKNVAEKLNGKKVIIRTLDIGADKKAGYLNLAPEENPALGYRAIRICLDNRELFKTQLRAICRASAFGNLAVMFPMITSVWEIRECKAALIEAQRELDAEGIPYSRMEVGIMVETPASVIIRDDLAKEVDFFSVGTNDLIQYTLAADRQNQKLERYANPHHPAILEMLRLIVKSAADNGIWAGICGELAGDLTLTDTFIEMGYSELSVAPPLVLPLRKTVRESEI